MVNIIIMHSMNMIVAVSGACSLRWWQILSMWCCFCSGSWSGFSPQSTMYGYDAVSDDLYCGSGYRGMKPSSSYSPRLPLLSCSILMISASPFSCFAQ